MYLKLRTYRQRAHVAVRVYRRERDSVTKNRRDVLGASLFTNDLVSYLRDAGNRFSLSQMPTVPL